MARRQQTDMRIVAVGDLHLGRDNWKPQFPAGWEDCDLVLLVGDVLDAAATAEAHSDVIYTALSELSTPVIVVPGNHDYQAHESFITATDGVLSADKARVTVGECTIGGLGSDLFDDGPELRGSLLRSEEFDTLRARLSDTAGNGNNQLQAPQGTARSARELYTDRLDALENLGLDITTTPTILLTHLPPYGTAGATLEGHPRFQGSVSWGSLAIREYLERTSLSVHFCGHIHEQACRDTVAGTPTINVGYRQAVSLTLTKNGIADLEWCHLDPSE